MERKVRYVERHESIVKQAAKERRNAITHHLAYIVKQHENNERSDLERRMADEAAKQQRIASGHRLKVKCEAGATPSMDRVVIGERLVVSLDEIPRLRHVSLRHHAEDLRRIEVDKKEKLHKLLVPLVKTLRNAGADSLL